MPRPPKRKQQVEIALQVRKQSCTSRRGNNTTLSNIIHKKIHNIIECVTVPVLVDVGTQVTPPPPPATMSMETQATPVTTSIGIQVPSPDAELEPLDASFMNNVMKLDRVAQNLSIPMELRSQLSFLVKRGHVSRQYSGTPPLQVRK